MNEAIDNLDYEKLAKEIANKMVSAVPPDRVIWTPEQCAKYMCVSKKHFGDCIANKHDFPDPLRLPSGGPRSQRRWLAMEVMDWFETKCKKRRPQK